VTPVSYYTPGEGSSPKFAYAFARGCQGTITDEGLPLFDGPVALFGSPSLWPVLRAAQADGRDYYYGDHAYFGRNRFYRITKNAHQHDGRGHYSPDRFHHFGRWVYPWRSSGSHIVVCPNSDIYFALHGLDGPTWVRETVATLKQHTDREIRVRWKNTGLPIQADLVDAWAVVAFSSAAAIDALIVGVPVFVCAPFCASYRMGLADLAQIESPIFPDDREPFLWALAYQQWTLSEMLQGMAWRALQEEEEQRAA
jgi:hypothetical protein